MKTKICHITTVHNPFDNRILIKECRSLATAGYSVVLVSSHEKDEIVDGVSIRAIPVRVNRLARVFLSSCQAFFVARRERAQVYHFHDPELIPVGIMLRLLGSTVIYDIHEDYITSIRQKSYVPSWIRYYLAGLVGTLEKIACNLFFTSIIAEKYYKERFPNAVDVLNYPIVNSEIVTVTTPKERRLLYTGNVTEDRGALVMASCLGYMKEFDIYVIGRCTHPLANKMRDCAGAGADRLHLVGEGEFVPFEKIQSYYNQGGWLAGLAVFPPSDHYIRKELTKFFEYMISGIPVVCSNFPVWRQLIEGNECGRCVDPETPEEIAEAVDWLFSHPRETLNMAHCGQRAVRDMYNWDREAEKLVSLYHRLAPP